MCFQEAPSLFRGLESEIRACVDDTKDQDIKKIEDEEVLLQTGGEPVTSIGRVGAS